MEETELFDVLIPPGVPRTIIRDVIEKYDVELVERSRPIRIGVMQGEERNLLAFRGRREVVEEVERYMLERLRTFIEGEESPR